jgi:hypothetical protein
MATGKSAELNDAYAAVPAGMDDPEKSARITESLGKLAALAR